MLKKWNRLILSFFSLKGFSTCYIAKGIWLWEEKRNLPKKATFTLRQIKQKVLKTEKIVLEKCLTYRLWNIMNAPCLHQHVWINCIGKMLHIEHAIFSLFVYFVASQRMNGQMGRPLFKLSVVLLCAIIFRGKFFKEK